MSATVTLVAHIVRAGHLAYGRKWSFLATFGMVFLVSLIALSRNDLLPEPSNQSVADKVDSFGTKVTHADGIMPIEKTAGIAAVGVAVYTAPQGGELPVSIDIPSIGLSEDVANPSSTDVAVLDKNLLSGTVRYPASATLGTDGNVIIFGHSSYLPVVHNTAYKAFNDIQKLSPGDRIVVHSKDTSYIYIVASVEKESAASEAGIPLQVASPRLTLATCDSFGKKTDRFVVTAVLVESRPFSAS